MRAGPLGKELRARKAQQGRKGPMTEAQPQARVFVVVARKSLLPFPVFVK